MRSRFMVSAVLAAAVLGGCNKDDTNPTNPGGPATKPSSKPVTTQPATVVVPPVLPPTITPAVDDAVKKAADALKNRPTTLPSGRLPTTVPTH